VTDPWRNRITGSASVPPRTLTPHPDNWRRHPTRQREELEAILAKIGVVRRVLVNKRSGYVVDGHLNIELAIARGATTIDVDYVDLTPEEEATVLAALDSIGLLAVPDTKALDALLARASIKLDSLIAAVKPQLDAMLRSCGPKPGRTDPDDAPPAPATPRSGPGDVWMLGRHVLVCGDAREAVAWSSRSTLERPRCLWTDPPYGVEVIGGSRAVMRSKRQGKRIRNDTLAGLSELLRLVFGHAAAALEPGAPVYVASPPSGTPHHTVRAAFNEGFQFLEALVWNKGMVLGMFDYHIAHEDVLYGRTRGKRLPWLGDRKQTSVFDIRRPARCDLHPTMKPVELVERMLANSTRARDVVIDPFGGSGSTLIACERLGRICFAIELDPVYVDVIVQRWQNHTGERAHHADGRAFDECSAKKNDGNGSAADALRSSNGNAPKRSSTRSPPATTSTPQPRTRASRGTRSTGG
jgi:DNA modification methylase